MAGKHNLRRMMAGILELPGDVVLDMTRISLIGLTELVVENHRGLTEYKPDRLALSVPEGMLLVTGADLAIGSISRDQIVVTGKILSLQFQTQEGGGE